ncbi:GMC family oxidoreductase N-terminal domain-containing protein [Chitinophaga pinensis]|uniref:Glucose-methanol-choline oxidoreductase n=1 Tax=Chitinophaga pinensis (strain ATCC 43595 / DSM 2588 / LMG 13176 / NBRC 15968 / NCIMB 11800 / UQM 2034) TaxID=485918 RepID=A0A979G4S0_CHIPD|nr:GMC family oxidoreductase N-terminal domain-containing protein [Chitinophaga pinensis]ACU60598.1 glucose-methanol-choline oxidoreductase [Chitinophaga pinensis DSM 2588]
MHIPVLFYFHGYVKRDPLDYTPLFARMLLAILINAILSVGLFLLAGPSLHFRTTTVLIVMAVVNSLLYGPLNILLRKCSSLVTALLVFAPFFLYDLYQENHFRQSSALHPACWEYDGHFIFAALQPPVLRLLLIFALYALIFGVLSIWLYRIAARLLFGKKEDITEPDERAYKLFFSEARSSENIPKPRRDFAFLALRILGSFYLFYLLVLIIGVLGEHAWPGQVQQLIKMTYANPALAINTYFKIILMTTLAFVAAYNKSLRYHCSLALFAGHSVSTVYALVFHYCRALQASDPTNFLLTSAITDGALLVLFVWMAIAYKKAAAIHAAARDLPINFSVPLTLVKYLYTGMSVLFMLFCAAIVLIRLKASPDGGIGAVYGAPDPMVGNTVTLYATLAVLCIFLINKEALRNHFFNALVIPLLAGGSIAVLWLITGDLNGGVFITTRSGAGVQVNWYFPLFALVHALLATLMIRIRKMYYDIDYTTNTLSPSSAINVMALSNAFFSSDNQQQASDLELVDKYAGGIKGRKRGLLNLPFALFENVLNLVYGIRPCFSSMQRDEQRYYLSRYFFRNEWQRKRAFIPPLAELAYQIGLSLNSIIMFANFSTINVRNAMGYVPVNARDRTQGDMPAYPPPHESIARLPHDEKDPANFKPAGIAEKEEVAPRVTTPVKEEKLPQEVDYFIVGSGAGGAVAAYRLACTVANPGSILLLERGTRYQPLQDFQDTEIEMMKKVYKEGGLQQTKTFSMTLLQGECVGGTTVVNNAVCFTIPNTIREIWQQQYDIDLSGLDMEYQQIAAELSIKPLEANGVNREVAARFSQAVERYNRTAADKLITTFPVLVNHLHTMGDGNWNLGNKRMRKRSMLETYIPWAESRGVKVIPNMTAVQFIEDPAQPGRAGEVIVRADNGNLQRVKVRKAVIVAGGVISSSHFLMRSGVKNENIGKRLSCNFALPVAFEFDRPVRAYDGDQITMAAMDSKGRAIFETYFNPPASFGLSSIPFFFDRRDAITGRYCYYLNLGALIGSSAGGEVLKKADLINGQAFVWQLGEEDISKIKFAIEKLIELGRFGGAVKAVIPTKPGIEIDLTNEDEVDRFIGQLSGFPVRMKDLPVSTAHPQGGNLMAGSQSPHRTQRVVDESFCLEGYNNVFVADASLFPVSITVNPQWTIMALSSLACKQIVSRFK